MLRYDATQPAALQLTALREPPTQLYYYATGQIFRRKSEVFQEDLFREFCAIYVSGFYNLCASLSPPSGGALAIFYPSSIAVEQRPRDLAEYAMAKAAGEILCAELARSMPSRRVVVKRLPRILTDQTASVLPVKERVRDRGATADHSRDARTVSRSRDKAFTRRRRAARRLWLLTILRAWMMRFVADWFTKTRLATVVARIVG